MAVSSSNCTKTVEALVFNDPPPDQKIVDCILCDNTFNLDLCFPIFLKHLFEVHNVVIEDVQGIKHLKQYLQHWKKRLSENELTSIIPSVKIDSTDRNYFLFTTLLKEDKTIRHKLQLAHTLEIQEYERNDANFSKTCLLCKDIIVGTREDYLKHLSSKHNLQLGNPQNLVFVDDLLAKIERKLNDLQCIYCEKQFHERTVLKEHMRKKLHKRINPKNRTYDKYYIINYLEQDTDWKRILEEHDSVPCNLTDEDSDDAYSDWKEGEKLITCLFCDQKDTRVEGFYEHLKIAHEFDFQQQVQHLNFYQRVKLINYIRRQVQLFKCILCDNSFKNVELLQSHLKKDQHCRLPDLTIFDQPEYYFPTFEDDTLLYFLEDTEN